MVRVSVIIPVYNAEKYVGACIESVRSQTEGDWELLLVADCPTDNSLQIAREYAQKDKRIRLIENTRNCHIGESRNIGLENARGEYVVFMDDDDSCTSDMLSVLLSEIETKQADIVFSEIVEERETGSVITESPSEIREGENCRDTILDDLIGYESAKFNQIHGAIYRRETIEKNKIRFVDTRQITGEDVVFNIEMLLCSREVRFISRRFYTHYSRENSEGQTQAYLDINKGLGRLIYIDKVIANATIVATGSEEVERERYERMYDKRIVRECNTFIARAIINRHLIGAIRLTRQIRDSKRFRLAYLNYKERGGSRKMRMLNKVIALRICL